MERNHAARIQRNQYVVILAILLHGTLFNAAVCFGGDKSILSEPANSGAKVRVIRSQHIILHTDLERSEARKVINRLSGKLREVAAYWSRNVSDPIRCYVVDDLHNWTAEELDDPYAREVIQRVGGFATRHPSGAKMYSSAELDVALHEVVHAYCLEAFPDSGPDWYKEGMACMLATTGGLPGIQADREIINYLRKSEHRTARSIIESREFTSPIAKVIQAAVDRNSANDDKPNPGLNEDDHGFIAKSANSVSEQKLIDKANDSYRWSWALCYFLENNENYTEQLHTLGKAYLTGSRPRFDRVFADNADRLESEFRHFIRNLDAGYQVNLCSWNWDDASKSISSASTMTRVAARRGLQSTKLRVAKGSRYAITTDGLWSINATGPKVSAKGNNDGSGRLTAAVLSDTDMGSPIVLDPEGVFTATDDGTLFFRCSDHWHEIGDNRGCIRVTIHQLPSSESTAR